MKGVISGHLWRSRQALELSRQQAQAALELVDTGENSVLARDIIRAIWRIEDAATLLEEAHRQVAIPVVVERG